MQKTFSQTIVVDASYEEVQAYYSAPTILYREMPPWQPFGWSPRRTPMICEHLLKKLSDGRTEVTAHITYTAPYGELGKILFTDNIEKKLKRLVAYQQKILKEDMRHRALYKERRPLKVLLTGASGFVGRHLLHLLPVFNHQVFSLVRRTPRTPQEIYWDFYKGEIDHARLENFDAVIHLSGESIVAYRWTEKKKRAIEESRVFSTRFLTKTLNALNNPPKILLCASAIGFYGDCKGRMVDESSLQGQGFLADVCSVWEESARQFTQGRVVSMRFGTVMGSQGGFLSKFLPTFKIGAGVVVGTGSEYINWISLEDLNYQIVRLLHHEEIQGIVNLTTSYPVTSREFAYTLGNILHRPVWMHIPAPWIKMLLGEMGEAQFLNSAQVVPNKLQQSHAVFSYPHLQEMLQFNLGLL